MQELLHSLLTTTLATVTDIAPIIGIIFGFQLLVLRRPIPHLKQVLVGLVFVLFGLALDRKSVV